MATQKKQNKLSTKFKIIRDTREQSGKGWSFRASANCTGMEKRKLDVGDYAIDGLEDTIMIERKTVGDLWGTLGNTINYQRFLREMKRAKDHRLKFLIIEGTLADIDRGYRWSKLSANNIHAKLVSLQVKHNLHVIFTGRTDRAQAYVRKLMAKLYRYYLDGTIQKVDDVTSKTT